MILAREANAEVVCEELSSVTAGCKSVWPYGERAGLLPKKEETASLQT